MRFRQSLPLILAVWLLLGALFIPRLGLQNDEALISLGIYAADHSADRVNIAHRPISIMLMSYVGALKSWLYVPILAVFSPTLWAIRIPVLLAGAVTIWLVYLLLFRAIGPRAAWIGALLLAVDPAFLLTTVFDWGPVALQHLLEAGALLALLRFHESGRRRWLAFGFFLAGLWMWDKAIASWALAGLALAALTLFRTELARALRPVHIAVAAVALLLGAAPLVLYNVRKPNATLSSNARWEPSGVTWKAKALVACLDGSALFGYLARSRSDPAPAAPGLSSLETASAQAAAALGDPRRTPVPWLLALACLTAPWLLKSTAQRFFYFCILAAAVAWLLMAVTRDAGTGAHHVVLLWPLPQIALAAWLDALAVRWPKAALAGAGALVLASFAVLNTYSADITRYGASAAWTDAIHPAADHFNQHAYRRTVALDWGFANGVRLLTRGRVDPIPGGDLPPRRLLAEPDTAYIRHAGFRLLEDTAERDLFAYAQSAGFFPQTIALYKDRQGRPLIELFRFVPSQP